MSRFTEPKFSFAGGTVKAEDQVTIHPRRLATEVRSLERYSMQIETAKAGKT